ncbi:MAG: hypothetical protein ACOCP8_06025 [archaeon]
MLTPSEIEKYLYYGYIPRQKPLDIKGLFSRYEIHIQKDKNKENIKTLIQKGSELLDKIFKDIAVKVGNKKVVIPLSGGMDSRAILGGILKYLPKEQIETVTIGIPGALDYELGQKVAKKAGVVNKVINLDEIIWSEQKLINYACNFKYPIRLLDGYLYSQIFRSYAKNTFFISGFLGDPLSGSHLPKKISNTWNEAIDNFNNKSNYLSTKIRDYKNSFLPSKPFLDKNLMPYDEQLDLFIRQRYYIKPIVLLKDKIHITPFLYPKIIEFFLNLPNELRKGQLFYKKLLLYKFPELFSVPLKNTGGFSLNTLPIHLFYQRLINKTRSLWRIYNPVLSETSPLMLNYIDFEESLRNKYDLKKIAIKNLKELSKRDVIHGMDIQKIWNDHQSKRKNNTKLINLLISLEIYYKSQKI